MHKLQTLFFAFEDLTRACHLENRISIPAAHCHAYPPLFVNGPSFSRLCLKSLAHWLT
jgi:hypothetical protein